MKHIQITHDLLQEFVGGVLAFDDLKRKYYCRGEISSISLSSDMRMRVCFRWMFERINGGKWEECDQWTTIYNLAAYNMCAIEQRIVYIESSRVPVVIRLVPPDFKWPKRECFGKGKK